MSRVLVIGYVWPEPGSSAAGSRMLQLLDIFRQQGSQIIYSSPAADSDYRVDPELFGIEYRPVVLNHHSFDEFIQDYQPEIVIFDRFMMEEQFGWRVQQNCPQALRILETVDLHSLRHARQQAVKQQRQPEQRDFLSDIALREIASIYRCDLSLIISPVEMDILQEVYHVDSAILHYCPFMVDASDKQTIEALPDYEQREGFIFIGNFRHAPNWDAVQYLKQTIWPGIRKRLPQAQLYIYGAYTTDKARQLHKPAEGFHICGRVDDAAQVLRSARVSLAPLRFGAGMKGKLLDAMQTGTPSVTTSIGAEGMHADLPWSGVIEDDADEYCKAAARLYQHKQDWHRAQQDGFDLISQVYDKSSHAQAVQQRIDSVLQNIAQHRMQNFTGAMLSHHTMKSTHYMSRWIEAKNSVLSKK